MQPNWTVESALEFVALLREHLGAEKHYEFSHTVRGGERASDQTKLAVYYDHADKSRTQFDTDYSTGVFWSEDGLPRVQVCFKRSHYIGDQNVGAYRFEEGQEVVAPADLAGWCDKVAQWSKEVDVEFAKKVAVAKKEQEKKEAVKKRRVVLVNLVAEDKLSPATLKSYEYDPGDKRSCGSLEVLADTPKGVLKLTLVFGTSGAGEAEDFKVTLNGKECNDEGLNSFDPGCPHYYAGSRACEAWEQTADKALQDALDAWLANE